MKINLTIEAEDARAQRRSLSLKPGKRYRLVARGGGVGFGGSHVIGEYDLIGSADGMVITVEEVEVK